MHTLALPKSVSYIELGPQWPLAHYELVLLIKKKKRLFLFRRVGPHKLVGMWALIKDYCILEGSDHTS